MHLRFGHQHSRFWSILTRFMDYYLVLGSRSDFHDCRTPGCQHSQFWLILARFVDYCSLFWGPGVISTIKEPLGALTGWLSTLVVFVDSDPFRGLLLTVLGPQSDFHGC